MSVAMAERSGVTLRPASASATLLRSTLLVTRRSLLKFIRTPQLVVLGTVQGAIFLLIYRYVFGGAIHPGGVAYVDFLLPGFIATMVLFVGMGAATGTAEDMHEGFVDRLRSLPIPRTAVLAGRVISDTMVLVWGLAVTTALGFAMGFRFHGSVGGALAGFALCVAFGFAFEWMFVGLGAMAGNAQAAQGIGFLVFPITFVSSAYVPVQTMPGWLQAFADHQPVTMMVDAVRSLALGPQASGLLDHTSGWYVVRALLWAAAIMVVFAPLAVSRLARVSR